MNTDIAQKIAALLNSQNELSIQYIAEKVLDQASDHVYELESGRILGVIRIERVQWYQVEISHLSVQPDVGRSGIGTRLLKRAEDRAVELGARIAQCTIRTTNTPSINFFTKHGYRSVISFRNVYTGNALMVFQRSLTA